MRGTQRPDIAPTGKAPVRNLTRSGRFRVEPGWPYGGGSTVRSFDRNWTVQRFTGAAVSTVPAGGWVRGQLMRSYTPAEHFPPISHAYDPTSGENVYSSIARG